MLGDSLRSNRSNLIPVVDRERVKQKLLSGKYAYLGVRFLNESNKSLIFNVFIIELSLTCSITD